MLKDLKNSSSPSKYPQIKRKTFGDIVNAHFPVTHLHEPINQVIPLIDDRGMLIICYGIPGARKSTLAAAMVEYAHNVIGKSAYVYGEEESESYPSHERLTQINGKDGLIIEEDDFEQILAADNIRNDNFDGETTGYFAKYGYKFVVIDSADEFKLNITHLKRLKKKNPGVIFFVVLQVTKSGKARGSNQLIHGITLELVCSRNGDGEGFVTMEKTRVGGKSGSFADIQEIIDFVKNRKYLK